MQKNSIERRILYIALIITAIGTILFSALIAISYSYVVGWLVGTGSVLLTYLLSLLILKLLFKKKNFKHGMLVTSLRIVSMYAIHIGIIIAIVAIDKSYHGYGLMDNTQTSVVYDPINIFSYLGGVSIIAISTLISHFKKKGSKDARI